MTKVLHRQLLLVEILLENLQRRPLVGQLALQLHLRLQSATRQQLRKLLFGENPVELLGQRIPAIRLESAEHRLSHQATVDVTPELLSDQIVLYFPVTRTRQLFPSR